jgi:carotenoid phi-ring synthase / carotenoid chi-ring synthase
MSRRPWTPGKDRRAEQHPAAPGATSDGGRHRVVVIGGGVAGLAAATALAERGVAVTLFEQHDQLGGRVRAWPVEHADGPATMSRGFHAFFRQYYNLRSLLRRTDPALERLTAVTDYPLVSAEGFRDSFARIPRTPPFNLATFVLRSATFTLADLRRVDTAAAAELLDVEFPRTFSDHDGESAAQFLDRLRFPSAARHLALEVFARSFFAHPGDFAAGELIAMFHAYFLGSAEGLLFDVPDDDYDTALWEPLGRYLQGRGVDLRAGTAVDALSSTTDGVRIDTAEGPVDADAAVVACDLRTTQRLVTAAGAVAADDGWRARVAALRHAPPFAVWRLWFDHPAAPDRPAFLGTAGFGCVDNISVLERFEAGAAQWAEKHRGSVVELHAYALDDETSDDGVRSEMHTVLNGMYPEYAGAGVVAQEYLRSNDCPLVGTEPWAARPGVATPDPRVVLAGDGVRCDFPVALMERAATTGFQAANQLLGGWQLAGHELWTVPTRARTRLARHAGRAAAAAR